MRALHLPERLAAQIGRDALVAFPGECCGLIEGVRDGDTIEGLALHPTRNLAAAADRFEIDPEVQFKLLRALRGSYRAIVGCYHSHPNGRAEPSARDLEYAVEDDFVWLIAALDAQPTGARLAAFVCQNRALVPLVLTAT